MSALVLAEVILPAEAAGDLSAYWSSREMGAPSSPEDLEMALAAWSRAFDVQMGTTGGPRNGVRPLFPNTAGGDFRDRKPEPVDVDALFSMDGVFA